MNLDELHRAAVPRKHREGGESQVSAEGGIRVRRFGRYRRRAVPSGVPKAAHDVFWFDAWPHDDAYLCERRSDFREFDGERLLGVVDVARSFQKFELLVDERGALLGAERRTAIALRATGRHDHDFLRAVRACVREPGERRGEACGAKRMQGV